MNTMCGLFGVVSQDESKSIDNDCGVLFHNLALSNEYRGPESFGVSIQSAGHIATHKAALCVVDAVKSKRFSKLLNSPFRSVIGHTRMASFGVVTKANAHPFTVGGITLAHNGTLTQATMSHVAAVMGIDPTTVPVDSIYLAHWLNSGRKLNDLLFQHKLSAGSFAVTYRDAKLPNHIFFYRHTSPLSIARHKESGRLCWSSELSDLCDSIYATRYGRWWHDSEESHATIEPITVGWEWDEYASSESLTDYYVATGQLTTLSADDIGKLSLGDLYSVAMQWDGSSRHIDAGMGVIPVSLLEDAILELWANAELTNQYDVQRLEELLAIDFTTYRPLTLPTSQKTFGKSTYSHDTSIRYRYADDRLIEKLESSGWELWEVAEHTTYRLSLDSLKIKRIDD